MIALAPNLFERRFGDLVTIGRAKLPALAPEWTDHNAHDPGITLIELLAWVGEAQLYSLSRLRRDERAAYAALLGIAPSGARGATGAIWPDALDPESPARTFSKSVVIGKDAPIVVFGTESPTFSPTHDLLWAPGTIRAVVTSHGSGAVADHTRTNERGIVPFLPFGETAGRRDALLLSFACRDEKGLLGAGGTVAPGTMWPIGVLAAPPIGGAGFDASAAAPRHSPLVATLISGGERTPLPIVSDTTRGMLTSGVILLDVGALPGPPPADVTIDLRPRSGLPRPPRVLRLEPNVIPILQGRAIVREAHAAVAVPDWSFTLDEQTLRFAADEQPVSVEVQEPSGVRTWRRARLAEQGPDDTVFEIDTRSCEISFGNGVNGRIPPAGSTVLASYAVCDADRGNVPRNRKWRVAGFGGTFGINPDPVTGGTPASDWVDQRREARRRSKRDHALVSRDDIVAAAKNIPLLEVVRAWVVAPDVGSPRTGVVTLVAMRSRPGGIEPESVPETPRWLAAVRRALVARMPLGTRLAVVAPRYVPFSIAATVEAMPGRDTGVVRDAVEAELTKRLTLVDQPGGLPPRQPGVPVTERDIAAWISSAEGVARLTGLALRDADGRRTPTLKVSRSGLPRATRSRQDVTVNRPAGGAR